MIKSISLPDEILEEGEDFAKKNGQTFSGLVRVSLEEYLSNKLNLEKSDEIDK